MGKDMTIDKDAMMAAIFSGIGTSDKSETKEQDVGDKGTEEVEYLSPELLVDFHSNELGRQPYQVRTDNADFFKLVESASKLGVFEPIITRPDPLYAGKYEIISGHRRNTAALKAGLPRVPMIKRNITDDEANIIVCDANLHREDILPSEKGWAYRLKLEAMNRQGKRTDLTSVGVQQKLKGKTSRQIVAEENGESEDAVRNYVRITYLSTELLEMVDKGFIRLSAGVELSYLNDTEQTALLDVLICDKASISFKQAKELRAMSKEGRNLTIDLIHVFLQKKTPDKSSLNESYLNKHLPNKIKHMTLQQKMLYTTKALKYYNDYIAQHPEELDGLELMEDTEK